MSAHAINANSEDCEEVLHGSSKALPGMWIPSQDIALRARVFHPIVNLR